MAVVYHKNLNSGGTDLHEPKDHASRHAAAGADAITSLGGVTFSSFATTPSSAPTNDYHIANKKYVDDLIAGSNELSELTDVTITSAAQYDHLELNGSSVWVNVSTLTIATNADILPQTDNSSDLGSSGVEFKNAYFDGSVYIDTLYLSTSEGEGVAQNFAPVTTTYSLGIAGGDPSKYWGHIYVNAATIGTEGGSELTVDSSGNVVTPGTLGVSNIDLAGQISATGTTAVQHSLLSDDRTITYVGDSDELHMDVTFAPSTAGGGSYAVARFEAQSGGAEDFTRLMAVTANAKHEVNTTISETRGFSNWTHNSGGGTITSAYGTVSGIQVSGGSPITNGLGNYSNIYMYDGGGVVGSYYGNYIDTYLSAGTITNWYGLYITEQVDANSRIPDFSANDQVRVGITIGEMPTVGAYTGTTCVALDFKGTGGIIDGIRFGGDTVLYRSAANTLSCGSDNFITTGDVDIGSAGAGKLWVDSGSSTAKFADGSIGGYLESGAYSVYLAISSYAGYYSGPGGAVYLADATYAINVDRGDIALLGDDIKVVWGAAGATDSYIQFGGANFEYYSSGIHDFTGSITTNAILTGSQLVASIADGTTPMTITSTTVVANLNVDQVDGYDLDQDVSSGASPTFTGTNITGVPAASILAGSFGTGSYVIDATLTAEQLTSTDDITMQGHLFTMGDAGAATDSVMSFLGSTNSGDITYDESADEFDLGDAALTTTGISRLDGGIGIGTDPSAANRIYAATGAGIDPSIILASYSRSTTDYPQFRFYKSYNDTIGTLTKTVNGQYIGQFLFLGVDTGPSFDYGGLFTVQQRGNCGTKVPCDFKIGAASANAFAYQLQMLGPEGAVWFPIDGEEALWGAGKDAKILFTGSQFQFQSDVIGATNGLLLRAGTDGLAMNIGATEQIILIDGALKPTTDNDIDIGDADQRIKDIYQIGKHHFFDTAIGIYSQADTFLDLFADGGVRIGDSSAGAPTNYTEFEADGTPVFIGTATVWNDMQFQISDAKVTPASLLPSWEAFTTNTSEYAFSVNDEVDTSANEIPHSWKEGTAGNAHIHITTKAINDTEITYAKFTITFAYADTDEVWTETPLTAELTIANPTAALTNLYLDLGDITLTNYLVGAQMRCRVKRIAATTGTEYVGDIFITQVGIHFEEDTVGSRQEILK